MSTPEERIALKREVQGSRRQKTGRMLVHAKGNQRAVEWSKTGRGQMSCSSALSSPAERLQKTEATCAVMTVVCSLGEKAETQQGFQELKQVCADPRSIVTGTSKARRPLKLQQTPAEGRDH